MSYRIEIERSAGRELARLELAVRRRLRQKIQALATDPRPRGAKKLRGSGAPSLWRVRSGDYRIVYEIRDQVLVVVVVTVGHRREVYR